jgi:hypothetical protein
VPKTRPGMLSWRFARRDRVSHGAGRPDGALVLEQ